MYISGGGFSGNRDIIYKTGYRVVASVCFASFDVYEIFPTNTKEIVHDGYDPKWIEVENMAASVENIVNNYCRENDIPIVCDFGWGDWDDVYCNLYIDIERLDLGAEEIKESNRHHHTRYSGKLLRHRERLREETLHLTGAVDREPVLIGEFIHSENRDYILKFLVALKYLFHPLGRLIMVLAHNVRVKDA